MMSGEANCGGRTPGAVRAMAEAITLIRALSGGGGTVTFDGEFYHVSGLDPATAPAPRVFTGSVGPKSLAVTGQLADGWIPPGGSDWLSQPYRESRPRVDAAAVAAGRDPAEVVDVYNFGGRITPEPLAATRGEDGRWIGGVRSSSGSTSSPPLSWSTMRPASSTATPTTPPPTSPWPAGPPRSSPPSVWQSPDSPAADWALPNPRAHAARPVRRPLRGLGTLRRSACYLQGRRHTGRHAA